MDLAIVLEIPEFISMKRKAEMLPRKYMTTASTYSNKFMTSFRSIPCSDSITEL